MGYQCLSQYWYGWTRKRIHGESGNRTQVCLSRGGRLTTSPGRPPDVGDKNVVEMMMVMRMVVLMVVMVVVVVIMMTM